MNGALERLVSESEQIAADDLRLIPVSVGSLGSIMLLNRSIVTIHSKAAPRKL
jgi:hypothetical protein